jgi:hypothetical protein
MPFFVTEVILRRPPGEVFDFICDLSRWPLFRGYGPIPGIEEARLPEGDAMAVGSRVRVRNTDGSVHHEVVTRLEPGRAFAVRMELSPPASLVLARIEETVDLTPVPGGTRMVRSFTTTPRSSLVAPLAWLVGAVLLRKATEAQNRRVARILAVPASGG